MIRASSVGRLLAAALLLVATAACSSDGGDAEPDGPTPSAAPRTPEEPLPAPANGTCHRIDYATAVRATADDSTVACRKPHTSRTIKVASLKGTVDGHFLAVDSQRLSKQPAKACDSAFASYVGGTTEQQRLSMLAVASFGPSVEESDRGATWIRCDLVSVIAPEKLGNLPGPLKGVLDTDEGRDRFGMCGTAKPGTADFARVACSQEHSWRSVATVDIPAAKSGRWPGEARARGAGQEPCAEAARASATDALSYEWGYEWPDKAQWQAGRRHGICWAPD